MTGTTSEAQPPTNGASPDLPPLPLGALLNSRADRSGLSLAAANGTVRINVLAEDVVRVHALRDGQDEPETSWAVLDGAFSGAPFTFSETERTLELETSALTLSIRTADSAVTVTSRSGVPLLRDASLSWTGDAFRLAWTQPADRRLYGCGEKAGPMERRGAPMVMWNTDAYAYHPGTEPLYQSIPFYLAMDGGEAHGFFLDNTFRQTWDMGTPGEASASIVTDGGAADFYVFAAPDPKMVLARYTQLTGRTPLPPLWSVGYQQSRYSYYPEAQVREIAREFRKRAIPCDVLYLDIHYMQAYKDFTWDPKRFPDPKRLLSDLKADGFRMVCILDPGVKVEDGYRVYEELKANGFAVKSADGSPFVGKVWPGECLFPDFTDAKCRAWWGEQYRSLLDDGVAGFWNDMNEPAVFETPARTMPPDARFCGDGFPGDHRRYHNIYGQQMARASFEGVQKLRPDERVFLVARAGYAGSQRYGATWTGDNRANWDHLRMSVAMVLNLGLSGQPVSGPDIGGFVGDPTPELFTRWLQAGALMPFCRVHSAKMDHDNPDAEGFTPQEPWAFGPEWEDINRASIELRYRLLPTLYTLFEEAARTGLPILRPLFLEYPDDPRTRDVDDEFLLGRDILCAPILEEGATSRALYLPAGEWYDFWSDERLEGAREITVDAPIDRLPLYVRAGAALPMLPVVQNTDEAATAAIRWRIYLGPDGAVGGVYEDDSHSLAYRDGAWRRTTISAREAGGAVEVTARTAGTYESPRPPASYEIIGLPNGPISGTL